MNAVVAKAAPEFVRQSESRPGRTCPTAYRYSPRVFDRAPDLVAETLYVAGGLYGNLEALACLLELVAQEPRPAAIVFNGDFHWFDAVPEDFARVNREVLAHHATRGNVETELAGEDSGAGCGCAYPPDVDDAQVARSNEILAQLRQTARAFPDERGALGALPMHRVARVGEARVGIVHGDAASLAGWGFAHQALDNPAHARWLASAFAQANVDLFASSHTCLPALRCLRLEGARGVVANNGAAGMPNFRDTRFGIVTRISVHPARGERLYGVRCAGAFVDALPVRYDAQRFERRFLSRWPAGSAAHVSYFRRMAAGPAFDLASARPFGA
jgi:hypothetical protein